MARCKRCRIGVPHDIKHGITGYKNCSCRCDICLAANRTDTKRYADYAKQWQRVRDDPEKLRAKRAYERRYRSEHVDLYREKKASEYDKHREDYLRRASKSRLSNRIALSAKDRRRRASRAAASPCFKSGSWTPLEDAIAMRDDLTLLEMAVLLGRSYAAVHNRRYRLRNPNAQSVASMRYRQKKKEQAA